MTSDYTLDASSTSIQYLCRKDKHLAKVIQMVGPLSYRLAASPYAFLVSQIIGQMLSNRVAAVFTARLQRLCGGHITPSAVQQLTDDQILTVGLSRSKRGYIRGLTAAVMNDSIDFAAYHGLDDQGVMRSLTSLKGIGNWSAKMYLIFVLDRQNVLPFEDRAFLQGYGWVYKTDDWHKQAVMKRCHKWQPYSSVAARYLYVALDRGLTKQPFHLFK